MKNTTIALIVAAGLALGSVAAAPAAGAVPCRVIPAPGCSTTEQADDPMKPKTAKDGKKSPRSSGNPNG